MRLGGVHHVSLNVGDLDAARSFYVDVLGLEPIERPDFGFPGLWLRCGEAQVHLIVVEGHRAPEGQHVAFAVDDLDRARGALVDDGIEVTEAMDVPGSGRQAFLTDPSGNLIELHQPS